MSQRESFWKDKRVLVTGSSGFLGSWMCKKLVEMRAHVIGLVREWSPQSYLELSGAAAEVTIAHGDLENYSFIQRILNEYEIDSCFHLAAQALVSVANAYPISTFESNIRGTWNVLEAARTTPNVKRILVASSDKAYGTKDKMPYTEKDPLEGFNPYDLSKTCADLISQMYAKFYDLPVAVARCGNLYGPGDLNWSRIVPGTMRSLIFNEEPIIRSDGTFLRDYFYVEDAVDAYLLLGENLPKIKGEAYNFGTEKPTSVIDLVNEIITVSKKKNLKPKILSTTSGEIKDQYLSCEKARSQLKWKHQTNLGQALDNTYRWYDEFFSKTNHQSKN